jgi:hypothetical protein
MAWASEEVIEIAPMSCRWSSAAIVVARIRDSAKASGVSAKYLYAWVGQ